MAEVALRAVLDHSEALNALLVCCRRELAAEIEYQGYSFDVKIRLAVEDPGVHQRPSGRGLSRPPR